MIDTLAQALATPDPLLTALRVLLVLAFCGFVAALIVFSLIKKPKLTASGAIRLAGAAELEEVRSLARRAEKLARDVEKKLGEHTERIDGPLREFYELKERVEALSKRVDEHQLLAAEQRREILQRLADLQASINAHISGLTNLLVSANGDPGAAK